MTMVITARHSSFQGEKKMPIWYYVKIMFSGGKCFGSLLDTNNGCIVEEYSSQVCFMGGFFIIYPPKKKFNWKSKEQSFGINIFEKFIFSETT
jgi:hypothetical protein